MTITAVVLAAGAMAVFDGLGWDEEGEGLFVDADERFGQVNLNGEIKSSTEVVKFITELRRDETVKGVILRVNSPGGAFGPSQEIYQAIKRLNAKKPVVASFASVAASGGYYAACPARLIMANPGTITGSIGVMSQYANFEELLGKVGVKFESFTTGDLKDAGSPFKTLSPKQRAYIEDLIRDLNAQFTGAVAEHRKLSRESLEFISDGRAMTGKRALEVGLVDRLGGREAAIDALMEIAGLTGDADEIPILTGPKPKDNWLSVFNSGLGLEDLKSLAALARLLRAGAAPALSPESKAY